MFVPVRILILVVSVVGIPAVAVMPLRDSLEATTTRPTSGSPITAGPSRMRPLEDTDAPRQVDDAPRQVDHLQRRLQALGVTYMRLGRSEAESGQSRYHFQCRLPLDDNRLYSRPFDAQADDPLIAMQSVLNELETWRAGRTP